MSNRESKIRLVREIIERQTAGETALQADLIARGLIDGLGRNGYEILSQKDLNDTDDTPRMPPLR